MRWSSLVNDVALDKHDKPLMRAIWVDHEMQKAMMQDPIAFDIAVI